VHRQAEKSAKDGEVDWVHVAMLAGRSEMQRDETEIKYIIDFVSHASGGIKKPWVLTDIHGFSNTLTVRRELQPLHLSKLGTTDLGIGGKPFWIAACVKTMLSSPTATSKNEAKFFQPSDFTAMSGKLAPYISQCEDMMLKAHKFAEAVKDIAKQITLVGRMDVRLVAHVFKRPILGQFASLSAIGETFWEELNELIETQGGKPLKTCPWATESSSDDDETTDHDGPCNASKRIIEMKAGAPTDVDAVNHFKNLGFLVGTEVVETASQKTFIIKAISKNQIDLVTVDKPVAKKIASSATFANEHTIQKIARKDARSLAKFHWGLK